MTLRHDIIAGYVGTGVMTLAPILALPVYLHALGPKLWGLISFVALLQALAGLLDAGFAQALTREFVGKNSDAPDQLTEAARLLCGFERLYWCAGFVVAILITAFSNVIAENWLNTDSGDYQQARIAVIAAALIFMVQFPGSVYRSALVGLQHQVAFNFISVLAVLFRHGGAVLLILYIPDLLIYLGWQVVTALLETLARSFMIWKHVPRQWPKSFFAWEEIRHVLPSALQMSAAVLVGSLSLQIDKIVLSKAVPLDQYGYYTIASTVAFGALQLVTPVMQACFPHIVRLHGDGAALLKFNRRIGFIFFLSIVLIAVLFSLVGRDVLIIWLHQHSIVDNVYPIMKILLIGTAMNVIYNIGYYNWLSNNSTRTIFMINLISLVLASIFTPLLVYYFGLRGGAFSWIALNSLGATLTLKWFLYKKKK